MGNSSSGSSFSIEGRHMNLEASDRTCEPRDVGRPGSFTETAAPMTTADEKCQAIEAAFGYRGDVTLTLADQSTLVGYMFNRAAAADPPFVDVFPKDGSDARRIAYDEIVAVALTGRDAAAGKSWQAWLQSVAHAESKGEIPQRYPEDVSE
jgi:hypothetical protein